jgi:hypothetical protein
MARMPPRRRMATLPSTVPAMRAGDRLFEGVGDGEASKVDSEVGVASDVDVERASVREER